MFGNRSKAENALISDIAKTLNAPPGPEDSFPTLGKRSRVLFWFLAACIGLAQIPMMLDALRSGYGYLYVLGWIAGTQFLWAVYYMLAGLKTIPYISRSPQMETIALCMLFYALPLYAICDSAFYGGFEHSHAVEIVRVNEDMIRYLVTTSFFNDTDLTNAVERFHYTLFYAQDLPTIDGLFSIYMMPLIKIGVMIATICQTFLMPLPLTRNLILDGYWPLWRIVLGFVVGFCFILGVSYALLNPVNGTASALYTDAAERLCVLFPAGLVFLTIAAGFRKIYNVQRLKRNGGATAGH